jgi:hypothetical protein
VLLPFLLVAARVVAALPPLAERVAPALAPTFLDPQ